LNSPSVWVLPKADTYFRPILEQDPRGFEIDHLESALSHCKNFRTAVDGGAHVGTWTRQMSTRFSRVLAFEPARDTFDCLRQNLAGYGNVSIYPNALGPTRCVGSVIDDPVRQGNTGARHLLLSGEGGDIEVLPLDYFRLTDLDFLKLDLEGYELFALKGAVETLDRCKPVVLIECKKFKPPRYGNSHEAAADYILTLGYREVARVRNDRIYAAA
jgi:FkbM family methyltransferase